MSGYFLKKVLTGMSRFSRIVKMIIILNRVQAARVFAGTYEWACKVFCDKWLWLRKRRLYVGNVLANEPENKRLWLKAD